MKNSLLNRFFALIFDSKSLLLLFLVFFCVACSSAQKVSDRRDADDWSTSVATETSEESGASAGLSQFRSKEKQIADGLVVEFREYENLFGAKQNVFLLWIDRDVRTIRPEQFSGCDLVSRVAHEKSALAAINGTFFAADCTSRNFLKIQGTLHSTNVIRKEGSHTLAWSKQGELSIVSLAKNVNPPHIFAGIGGFPLLVQDFEISIKPTENTGFFHKRHPRTFVAILPQNRFLFAVIDGRTAESEGLTIVETARLARHLGASAALNLDGGGSSTFWTRKTGLANQPTDVTGERPVADGVFVY